MTFSAERLTIDPVEEDAANVPLELIGGALSVVAFRTPTPAPEPRWSQTADADGDLLAGLRYRNRDVVVTVEILPTGASGAADAQATLATLVDKLAKVNREGGTLRRVLPTGDVLTFDLLAADAIDPRWDADWELSRTIELELRFVAKPFARGVEEARTAHVESARSVLLFTEEDIAGDVPALGRLVVSDLGGASRGWCQWGLQVATYDPASSADLFFEAEGRTPLNLASLVTVAGASGAGSSNVVSAGSLIPDWTAVLSTKASGGAHLTHVGDYRVLARLYRPRGAGQVGVALEWALGDFRSFTRNAPTYFGVDQLEGGFVVVDLGLVSIPRGTPRWEGRVIANSTAAGDDLSIDCLWLLPLERAGEASRREWEPTWRTAASPTAYLVRDEFDQSMSGGRDTPAAATGRTLPIGGTYTGAGDADDFVITNGALTRTALSDAAGGPNAGRLLVAGSPTFTTCQARVGMYTSTVGVASQGLLLRYVDASNHLAVGVVFSTTQPIVTAQVCVRGTYTQLAQTTYPFPMPTMTAHQLIVLAEATGEVTVWLSASIDTPSAPLLQAYDASLATGGALASGKAGVFDRNSTATAATRSFDNLWAWVPEPDAAICASQSLEIGAERAIREDAGGTLWTPVSRYEGDPLTIPPSGPERRIARFLVTASRAAPGAGFDRTLDDLQAQLHLTPRYLVVP
jgi:hypothetical protein